MTHIDLAFPLTATQPIASDHGYALYGALSRLVPEVHQENGIGVHPIRGKQIGDRRMMLMPWSALTLRVPDGQIAPLLRLAGKAIHINDVKVRIGVPNVKALEPATTLRSRLVVIKVAHVTPPHVLDETQFLAAARKQLDALGLSSACELAIPRRSDGQPHRRTLREKDRQIVGYELIVTGLTAAESLTLQSHPGLRAPDTTTWQIPPAGLAGRRHMGCGIFVPLRS